MSIHRYKYGGSTKCRHQNCPARVLRGGRCTKQCPLYADYESSGHCTGLQWIDHPHLKESLDGKEAFVSVHYFDPKELLAKTRDYVLVHSLDVSVIKAPFKGRPNAWHVHFKVRSN